MFDLDTILKAINAAGAASAVGAKIYADFHAVLTGEPQADLKTRYAAARERSDATHAAIQQDLG